MDIVFAINGICILVDIVISDSTHADLILWIDSSWGVVVMIVVQEKVVSYHDQHLEDDFIFLIVKIFECLHQQANDFLHWCANMAWSMKGFGGPLLSILCSFYRYKILLALQRIKFITIVRWAIMVVRKTSFKLEAPLSFLTWSVSCRYWWV
jgi:hypothetical protein